MELHIESTDRVTRIDGVSVRVWEGTTKKGTPCKVFVHSIAVTNSDPELQERFDRELDEQMQPGQVVPLNEIV